MTGCLPLTVEDGARFHPPEFADYPVTEDLRGRPAPVDLASHPLAARFRTRLREAADTGPNFAGYYTIASWGCGSGCIQYAIVNARDGGVSFPPEIEFVSMMRVCNASLFHEEIPRHIFAAITRSLMSSNSHSPAGLSRARPKESSITTGLGQR